MRNRGSIIIICLVLGSLATYVATFAHGTEKHGKTATADVQMKKLHAIMPMLSVASAKLESALIKRDISTVETEANKIIATVPDLKKSKPHKNIKQRKDFVEMATNLESAVTSTLNLAKKGDFAGAIGAFKKVEETCAACHAKFRD